jgi:predicted metal-dependent hydrolase
MKGFVQLALDWLDAKPVVQEEASLQPSLPVLPLSDVMKVAHFQHPRANRSIHLSDSSVAYCLKRGKRSTIGMSVGPDGLDVRAPRWVSVGAVEAVLLDKAEWIVRKLQEMQERQQQMQSTIIQWQDGAVLPFLGSDVVLRLDASHAFSNRGAALSLVTDPDAGTIQQVLKVAVAQTASQPQIRDAVQAWLMLQAKENFTERLNKFAPNLGVAWKKLSLSNASTRWGTASADGSIRLNWRLIHFKQDIIDYVVVHELSHLRVMNHSPLFWDTVRTVVPDYAHRRAQLRDEVLPRWA